MNANGSQRKRQEARDLVAEIIRRIAREQTPLRATLSPCRHARDEAAHSAELWDFVEGMLSPDAEEALRDRVEECAWCARRLHEIVTARELAAQIPSQNVEEAVSRFGLPVRGLDESASGHEAAAAASAKADRSKSLVGQVRGAVHVVLQWAEAELEALQFPGQLVPVPVASRGGGDSGPRYEWKGGVRFEFELAGRQMLLAAAPVSGRDCRIELLAKGSGDDLSDVVGELRLRGQRICVQPMRKTAGGFLWESDRIAPGDYTLALLRGKEQIARVDVTVLDPEASGKPGTSGKEE
ncbi:MAG: hypothetical protein KAY32_09850 [Candidatus Eisenbacteria sp.]|nr:hypothetical protein [Candidatus Eisenbacteria bacterium]